ncbi:MAG: SEL1-like repeat protein [Campylobacterales bacterium]|nr:SEL1-like repeat protein [Campylobacterales bacterium]
MEHLFKTEDIELYLIAGLFFLIIWLVFHTIRYYRSEKRKVKHLHRFASQGESNAEYALAKRYHKGRMVKKDCQKAAFWYQRAALKGDEKAKGYLEKFLENRKNWRSSNRSC